MAPVALGVEVAEIKLVLITEMYGSHGTSDLACHECLAAQRALMVKENAVRGVNAVGLAVIHDDPVGVKLCRRIGAAGIEGRRLALWDLLHLAVELRGRGLIEARLFLKSENADCLQKSERPDGVGIGGIFRRLETYLDMALGGEVVDFIRLGLLNDPDQVCGIRHVPIVEHEALVLFVGVLIEMLDPARIK